MKINEEKRNSFVIVAIEGETNIDTSPQLREAFNRYIRQGDKKIVVDCANLSYIDSSGLATLIEMLQRLKKVGGKLKLCSLAAKVKSIFEVTKLDKLFEIYPDCQKALEGFK